MEDEQERQSFVVALVDTPDQDAKAEAGAALYRHNVEQTGVDDHDPIGAKLSDLATGEVLGGLWGRDAPWRGRRPRSSPRSAVHRRRR